jgi:hypothetical protein
MPSIHSPLLLGAAAGLCMTALVVLFAVSHWLRCQPGLQPDGVWRRGDAVGLLHTLGWVSTIMLGVFTTAVLVVMAAALAWQVAIGSVTADNPVTRTTGSATSVPGPETKDAVSNAMTAVALVVTAVTLVLTVGTTWLGKQQRLLEIERGRLAEALRDAAQWQSLENQRLHAQTLLLQASEASREWLIEQGTGKEMMFNHALSIANHLGMLSAQDRIERGRSFDALAQYFDGTDASVLLEPLRKYCEACQLLAISRAWHLKEIRNPTEQDRLVKHGLWCLVLSEDEVRRRIGPHENF